MKKQTREKSNDTEIQFSDNTFIAESIKAIAQGREREYFFDHLESELSIQSMMYQLEHVGWKDVLKAQRTLGQQ